MENCRNARKAKLADKDGGVESSMTLIFVNGCSTFLVE